VRNPPQQPGARIQIHIERLVLDGVHLEPGGAERLQQAITAELERLLGEQAAGAPAGGLAPGLVHGPGGGYPRIDAGQISWAPEHGSAALGRQVAGALHEGLRTGPSGNRGRTP
jgi:hypothetical protein